MRKCEIFFDNNNVININLGDLHLVGSECDDILEQINKLQMKNAYASNKKITFETSSFDVTIYDTNKFLKSGEANKIPNLINDFNKLIKKYYRDRLNKLRKTNRKKRLTLVSTTSLVIMLVTSGFTIEKSSKNESAKTIESNKETGDLPISGISKQIRNFCLEQQNLSLIKNNTYILTAGITNDLNRLKDNNDNYIDTENNELEKNNYAYHTTLDYSDKTNAIKAKHANELYYDLAYECGNRWGISPNLVISMLTHETGGYYVNHMAVIFKCVKDLKITAYDFEQNEWKSFIFTNEPEKYINQNITCITKEDLNNSKTNISAGCLILRYHLDHLNHHVGASIFSYNLGQGRMKKLLKYTAICEGKSIEDILNDQTNLDFVKYANTIDMGDPLYLQHVMQFMSDPNIEIKYIDENGNIYTEQVCIEEEKKIR